MSELPEIERSTEVPASPGEVWERIVDGELAEEWMGVRIEPRPGGRVTSSERDMIGTVEEVSPGESITWSWREVDGDPSQVTIAIESAGDGTRVTITERLLEYRITGTPPVFLSLAA
ncbi:MAG TPA: SRPBCC domain-containing protein [Acidimicrobiia bacterium]|nr:SRPBCC domain-containing protein [Acidimicrobiia bacterium]